MTGSTREQEPNLHEVRETSVLTLYGVSTYTFAVAPSRARGLKRSIVEVYVCARHVAPSRARGLKLDIAKKDAPDDRSRPHGRVD